jgi:nitroreductase
MEAMMTGLFDWLAANPFPAAILLVALGVVTVFLLAYFQGREISLWPPRLSGRPISLPAHLPSSLSVLDAIRTRKSVRLFLDRPVEQEKLDQVLEAARLAPSASNRQEWRFVVVRQPETRKLLAGIAASQGHVCKAPLVIVACADTDEHIMQNGQLCYPIDVAIALDHLSLAAVELGLGTCWVGAFDEDKVRQLLDIPSRIRVVLLMPLGYPADLSPVEKMRMQIDKIVKYEHW